MGNWWENARLWENPDDPYWLDKLYRSGELRQIMASATEHDLELMVREHGAAEQKTEEA